MTQTELTTQIKLVFDALYPMIVKAIRDSRVSHKEITIRIIYEDGRNRVQLKQEETSIRWLNLASLKFNSLAAIPLEEEECNSKGATVMSALEADIRRLFSSKRERGNMEVTLKFREADLKSTHVTHYKEKEPVKISPISVYRS